MNGEHNDREQRLARVFVELADTLVDEFDVLEFLDMLVARCVELLDVSAAGVVLSDQKGGLRMAAASSERARLIELFAAQSQDGPCRDCVAGGEAVSCTDLADQTRRWPRFAPLAVELGFHTTHAVPMRLRRTVIGALNLLDTTSDGVADNSVILGQAFADVATIGMLQQRAIDDGELLTQQLQTALNSRVIIEQAKGVLAASAEVDMEQAFALLRGYARAHNQRLGEVARSVADGEADLDAITDHAIRTTAPRRDRHP
ncbi:MAG: GAF and ANTAR domain-containing protein [Sciscionella sp.]